MSIAGMYRNHRSIIDAAVRRAVRRWRMPADEALQLANLIFVQAYREYEAHRGPMKHLLRVRLQRLADTARREARRNALIPRVSNRVLAFVAAPVKPNGIWAELGPDATAVGRLALASRNGLDGPDVRRMLRQYFRGIGWTLKRFNAACVEIREAIR